MMHWGLFVSIICMGLSLQAGIIADGSLSRSATQGAATPLLLKQLSKAARCWTVDDGLCADRIGPITQARDGHLWVAGEHRMARLNSAKFEAFDLRALDGAEVGEIEHLLCDGDGTIWIFTRTSQVICGEHDSFTWYEPQAHSTFGRATAVVSAGEANAGVIAFFQAASGAGGAVYHLQAASWSLLTTLPEEVGAVVSAGRDVDNGIWFLTRNGELYRLGESVPHAVTLQAEAAGLAGVDVVSSLLLQLPGGGLAICGNAGLYTLSQAGARLERSFQVPLTTSGGLGSCLLDADGLLWMQMPGQALQICQVDGARHLITLDDSGFRAPATSLYLDEMGSVWVGSLNGLFQVAYSPFVTWTVADDRSRYRFTRIREDAAQQMWFEGPEVIGKLSIELAGIQLVDQHSQADAFVAADTDRSMVVEELWTDTGDHWRRTTDGLWYRAFGRKHSNYQRIALPESIQADSLRCMAAWGARLYLAAQGKGIYVYDVVERGWQRLNAASDEVAKRVRALHLDPAGRVWALSERCQTLSLYEEDSVVWHASYEALGFGSTELYGVCSDLNGGLWLSTDRDGVAYVAQQALLDRLKAPGDVLEVVWFDPQSGLGSLACSSSPQGIFRSRDGRIWVANSRGLSVVDPPLWRKHRSSAHVFPIHIEACYLDGVLIPTHELTEHAQADSVSSVRVASDVHAVEIHFSSMNHGFLGRTQYHYRLQGYETAWVDAGTQISARYQNLPHGMYSFEVASQHPNGQWTEASKAIALEVVPHWSERFSVRAGSGVCLLLLSVCMYRLRIRFLTQRTKQQNVLARRLIDSQEKERKRIAAELHDSLGQDLLLIKNSIDLAMRTIEDRASAIFQQLVNVSEISTHAVKEARRILANLRPVELDRLGLQSAVQGMVDRASGSSPARIRAELSGLDQQLKPADEIVVFRLLQEGLNNALKHAQATSIDVFARCHDGYLELGIRDNGVGFDFSQIRTREDPIGLGMSHLEEQVHLLNGELSISTANGAGTLVRIELPLSMEVER